MGRKSYLLFIPDLVSNVFSVFDTNLIVISPVLTFDWRKKLFTRSSKNVPSRVVASPVLVVYMI